MEQKAVKFGDHIEAGEGLIKFAPDEAIAQEYTGPIVRKLEEIRILLIDIRDRQSFWRRLWKWITRKA